MSAERREPLREEVEIREFMIFLAWFAKPGSFGVDCFSGSGASALTALRNGVFWVGIDLDKKSGIVVKAQKRLEQYYMFLKGEGLLPTMGLKAPAPTVGEGRPTLGAQGG